MSREGFKAECRDCPTVIGVEYGETIRNGVSSWSTSEEAEMAVRGWAVNHWCEEKHHVDVYRYVTFNVSTREAGSPGWRLLMNVPGFDG